MAVEDLLKEAEHLCMRFLDSEMGPREFVDSMEDWLLENITQFRKANMPIHKLLDDYWTWVLAMYQENEALRAPKDSGLLGPDELRTETELLLTRLRSMKGESPQ